MTPAEELIRSAEANVLTRPKLSASEDGRTILFVGELFPHIKEAILQNDDTYNAVLAALKVRDQQRAEAARIAAEEKRKQDEHDAWWDRHSVRRY
jgi:hypothetical protein